MKNECVEPATTVYGRSGYVYGFTLCSVAAADDVRVEIWRYVNMNGE